MDVFTAITIAASLLVGPPIKIDRPPCDLCGSSTSVGTSAYSSIGVNDRIGAHVCGNSPNVWDKSPRDCELSPEQRKNHR